MIEAEYKIDLGDYLAGHRLYLFHRRATLIKFVVNHLGWAFISAAFVAWLIRRSLHGHVDIAFWMTCTFAFVGTIIANQVIRSIKLRGCYRNTYSDEARKSMRLTANEGGLLMVSPGRSESRINWNAIEDYAANDVVSLFFMAKKRFFIVPHRALNDSQWAELRAMIPAINGQLLASTPLFARK
jgi:hypothetical protein